MKQWLDMLVCSLSNGGTWVFSLIRNALCLWCVFVSVLQCAESHNLSTNRFHFSVIFLFPWLLVYYHYHGQQRYLSNHVLFTECSSPLQFPCQYTCWRCHILYCKCWDEMKTLEYFGVGALLFDPLAPLWPPSSSTRYSSTLWTLVCTKCMLQWERETCSWWASNIDSCHYQQKLIFREVLWIFL